MVKQAKIELIDMLEHRLLTKKRTRANDVTTGDDRASEWRAREYVQWRDMIAKVWGSLKILMGGSSRT